MRRQHDHEDVGIEIAELPEHGDPVVVRQLVVEQDQVDSRLGAIQRLGGRAGFNRLMAVGTKPLDQRPANQILVIDDEHATWHGQKYMVREDE